MCCSTMMGLKCIRSAVVHVLFRSKNRAGSFHKRSLRKFLCVGSEATLASITSPKRRPYRCGCERTCCLLGILNASSKKLRFFFFRSPAGVMLFSILSSLMQRFSHHSAKIFNTLSACSGDNRSSMLLINKKSTDEISALATLSKT